MRSNKSELQDDLFMLPNRNIEQPLERLTLNGKHTVLPPLNSSKNEVNKANLGQNPYINETYASNKKQYENQDRFFYRNTAAEIRESDDYIDHIIKQTKHESKRKDNSFDELCATLVKQREIERYDRYSMDRVASPVKQTSHTRQKKYSQEEDVFSHSMSGKTSFENNVDDMTTPRYRSKGFLMKDDYEEPKQTMERPKSAKYGERRLSNRPRTGYGRRKQTKE